MEDGYLPKDTLAVVQELLVVRKLTVRGARRELHAKGLDVSMVSDMELARLACSTEEE